MRPLLVFLLPAVLCTDLGDQEEGALSLAPGPGPQAAHPSGRPSPQPRLTTGLLPFLPAQALQCCGLEPCEPLVECPAQQVLCDYAPWCPPVIKSTDTQRSRGHRHHGDTADLGAVARKPTSKGLYPHPERAATICKLLDQDWCQSRVPEATKLSRKRWSWAVPDSKLNSRLKPGGADARPREDRVPLAPRPRGCCRRPPAGSHRPVPGNRVCKMQGLQRGCPRLKSGSHCRLKTSPTHSPNSRVSSAVSKKPFC
ncbi:uncharacterized protein LOC117199678 [Orcinus orca]|uniref:uncharacterized protein LOC117199678 n=1 Tax=Orcinus orca TaxID=9733 RepID=UPI00211296CE|nr:uncharacterized protein LOC117199678 [Orcinus orca]